MNNTRFMLTIVIALALVVSPRAAITFTFTTIDAPGATYTDALGINPQGDIVGIYRSAGTIHGFLLHQGNFTTIDVPGATSTGNAAGINPRGDIVGDYSAWGTAHAFLLHQGSFTTIDVPGAIHRGPRYQPAG